MTLASFVLTSQTELVSAVYCALQGIRNQVENQGVRHYSFNLRKRWYFDEDTTQFVLLLDDVALERYRSALEQSQLILIAHNSVDGTMSNDEGVKFSEPWSYVPNSRDIKISCMLDNVRGNGRIRSHLVLLPKNIDAATFRTLAQIIAMGGRILDSPGLKVREEFSS